jgi:hypothetical protein
MGQSVGVLERRGFKVRRFRTQEETQEAIALVGECLGAVRAIDPGRVRFDDARLPKCRIRSER